RGSTATPAWNGLTVSLELPATVHIGQTFEYVAVLANPTGADVALTPCPNYDVTLTKVKAGGFHQLNCAVAAIPARGAVRFAMRLAVADYTPTGESTLDWRPPPDQGATAPPRTAPAAPPARRGLEEPARMAISA